jgi:hypothetical protein
MDQVLGFDDIHDLYDICVICVICVFGVVRVLALSHWIFARTSAFR